MANVCVVRPWYVGLLYLFLVLGVLVVLPVLGAFFRQRRSALQAAQNPRPPSPALVALITFLALVCFACAVLTAAYYVHEGRVVREYTRVHDGASPALTAAFHRQVVGDGLVGGAALVVLLSSSALLVRARGSSARADAV